MFYEEKVIDGIMCYRTQPNGAWMPMTPAQLTKKLIEAREERDKLDDEIQNRAYQDSMNDD